VKKKRAAKRTSRPKTRPVKLKHPLPPGAGPFGADTDPEDSERLRRLRTIIDDQIGWDSFEDQEAGDYEARLQQVAKQLRLHLHPRDVIDAAWIRGYATALAATIRRPEKPGDLCRSAGLTMKKLRAAGVLKLDLDELRKVLP